MKRVNFICITVCCVGMLILLSGCAKQNVKSYSTTDVSEYGSFDGHIPMEWEDIHSGLFIFPAKDTSGMTKESYFYRCEQIIENGYEIILVATYTESAYTTEVARLSNLTTSWDGRTQHILTAEEGFSYAAYVAAFAEDNSEYALLDNDAYRVIYVYRSNIRFLTPSDSIPQEYLPQEYQVPTEYYDEDLGGYSMYYFINPSTVEKDWYIVKDR